jgi:hypothetical protein
MPRPGPVVLPGADGHAGVREPGLLHRERGGGHRLLFHTSGTGPALCSLLFL